MRLLWYQYPNVKRYKVNSRSIRWVISVMTCATVRLIPSSSPRRPLTSKICQYEILTRPFTQVGRPFSSTNFPLNLAPTASFNSVSFPSEKSRIERYVPHLHETPLDTKPKAFSGSRTQKSMFANVVEFSVVSQVSVGHARQMILCGST